MEILKENEVGKKRFLTLNEMLVNYETAPETSYLWSGIKERSFGLIFGPSKSGKTIFCENLAMSIAMGKNEFFGYKLNGIPRKVLFVGLEEFWQNRAERNKMQYEGVSESEKLLLGENYRFQPNDFAHRIIGHKDWEDLKETIKESGADVVFIDSITRMNLGQLENSADSEKLMQLLRNLCYDLGITLICIHHTPKMYDNPITMDKIKGSSVFAQESDFAIAINKTSKNNRYMKNIFFRYASEDDEMVKEFVIESDCWLNFIEDVSEEELIASTDRRRTNNKSYIIVDYLNQNSSQTFSKSELYDNISKELSVKERQYGYYLRDLEKNNKIKTPFLGCYASVNYVNTKNEGANGDV